MSTTLQLPPGMDITLLTGPLLLASLFNWGLFGILIVQAYIYYIAFPLDNYKLKGVVAVTFILEMIQVILSTHDAFRVSASGWGNPVELDSIGLNWLSIPILSGIISCVCRLFYGWRIYALSGELHMPFIVAFLAVGQAIAAIYDGVLTLKVGHISFLRQHAFTTTLIWAFSSLACDVAVTGSMFYYLWRAKQLSSRKQTASLLTRLINLTVETGVIYTTATILDCVLFIAYPDNTIYIVPLTITSKLYTNCLIAVLNSRLRIFGGRNDGGSSGDMGGTLDVSFELPTRAKQLIRTRDEQHNEGITIDISQVTDAQLDPESASQSARASITADDKLSRFPFEKS
ncbi:hypothetical protein EIP91_005811 [Steccherinum ochraceum]|uniref:DUF6534 domain-containing protein n=1 Tax=Steccherinum ochraceum TaxID=92696 RepID=A0A4R0R997_9APHY|nr:hypothetical protein EIP91_005811 [Steccherinum ochraceum]